MSANKKLLINTLIYMMGNFGSKILVFIMLPLYTKYLTTNEYGLYDIITISIMLIIPIITFQFDEGIYRLVQDEVRDKIKRIISTAILNTIKNIIIVIFIILIANIIFPINNVILLILLLVSNIIYKYWLQISRALNFTKVYALTGIINTFTMLVSNIIFIAVLGYGIKGLIFSNVISYSISIIYIEFKVNIFKYINIKQYDKKVLAELKSYSIPLIPNQINWWIMSVSDRYILSNYLGLNSNGIYSVSNKFPNIVESINSIFNLAWQQTAIEESNNKQSDVYFNSVYNKFIGVMISILILLIPLTRFLVNILVSSEFNSSYKYIPILYIAVFFKALSSFIGVFYQIDKNTKLIFRTSIYGALINIVINVILIPRIGIQGATISTLISFYVMYKIRIKNLKKVVNLKVNKTNKYLYIYIILINIMYYFNLYINFTLLIIGSIVNYIYINKEILKKLT